MNILIYILGVISVVRGIICYGGVVDYIFLVLILFIIAIHKLYISHHIKYGKLVIDTSNLDKDLYTLKIDTLAGLDVGDKIVLTVETTSQK